MAELTNSIALELIESFGSDIIVPDIYTSIAEQAFQYSYLTSAVIPGSVTSIGDEAFEFNDLTSVEIGNGVVSIGVHAFAANDLTSVVIPDSVMTIGDNAFTRNKITDVKIGATSIGISAFQSNQITNVEFGDGVASIGHYAFLNNQLTSIDLPDSLTEIGQGAFQNNDLRSVFIPDNIEFIGLYAFLDNPNLESISAPLKYEKAYLLTRGLPDSVTLEIRDSPPTDIELSTIVFDENIAADSTVAFLNSVDADSTDKHSYTLVSGEGSEDNEFFEIDGNELKIKKSPDFEAKSSYFIRVETEDSSGGLTLEKNFQLTVRDVQVEVPDRNGDGFVDGITHYQLWTEAAGIDLKIGSRNVSDDFSEDWDAVKAVPYRSGFAVLIASEDRSRTTVFNVLFANSLGRVVNSTEWRIGRQMYEIGCEELFELDFNRNGVIDIV